MSQSKIRNGTTGKNQYQNGSIENIFYFLVHLNISIHTISLKQNFATICNCACPKAMKIWYSCMKLFFNVNNHLVFLYFFCCTPPVYYVIMLYSLGIRGQGVCFWLNQKFYGAFITFTIQTIFKPTDFFPLILWSCVIVLQKYISFNIFL